MSDAKAKLLREVTLPQMGSAITGILFQTTLRTVSLGLFVGMTAVAFLGIIWAIGLLILNWVFRNSR